MLYKNEAVQSNLEKKNNLLGKLVRNLLTAELGKVVGIVQDEYVEVPIQGKTLMRKIWEIRYVEVVNENTQGC